MATNPQIEKKKRAFQAEIKSSEDFLVASPIPCSVLAGCIRNILCDAFHPTLRAKQ